VSSDEVDAYLASADDLVRRLVEAKLARLGL
jgi:hypothetical protein